MAKNKITVSFEINSDSQDMLQEITEKYDFTDKSKAVRCLLDYVADDGDWDEIFDTIRCNHC
ncbi:MAG: hypothetical protein VX693_03850 [Pseudomonadota bacterium]|nr:hypothetical protein [Pseudomonadota bacterium]